MTDLKGRVALVTGAASGIGLRTAEVLAEAGAAVVVADMNGEGARQQAKRMVDSGLKAISCEMNVTSETDWQGAVDLCRSEFDGLNIVVNNAGIEVYKSVADTTMGDFQRVMDVNVNGVFMGIKVCADLLTESGNASIINLSSIAGLAGYRNQVAYCTSKAAVRNMTKAAAVEFARERKPIRVNSVHPGIIETPMMEEFVAGLSEEKAAVERAKMAAFHPMGRCGKPDDIANAILYLASDMSGFVTGAELAVDGGVSAN